MPEYALPQLMEQLLRDVRRGALDAKEAAARYEKALARHARKQRKAASNG